MFQIVHVQQASPQIGIKNTTQERWESATGHRTKRSQNCPPAMGQLLWLLCVSPSPPFPMKREEDSESSKELHHWRAAANHSATINAREKKRDTCRRRERDRDTQTLEQGSSSKAKETLPHICIQWLRPLLPSFSFSSSSSSFPSAPLHSAPRQPPSTSCLINKHLPLWTDLVADASPPFRAERKSERASPSRRVAAGGGGVRGGPWSAAVTEIH